jgi:branched-chain amino acid aminotransferase
MTVMELCAELDIGFEEREIQVYDVFNADEAMLPSTPYCLAPVSKINGSPIGSGEVQGPIFRRLIEAWSEKVGVDIVEQITQASA